MISSPSFTALQGNVAARRAQAGPVLPEGLVARLRFQGADDSTQVVDDFQRAWSTEGNAKLTGTAPTYGVSALALPDDTSFLQSGDKLGVMVPGTGDFAYEFWIETISEFTLLDLQGDQPGGLVIATFGASRMFIYTNSGPYIETDGGPLGIVVNSGAPLYICVQRLNGRLSFYVNQAWLFYGEADNVYDYSRAPTLMTLARRQEFPASRPGLGRINGFRAWHKAIHPRANLPAVPSPLEV